MTAVLRQGQLEESHGMCIRLRPSAQRRNRRLGVVPLLTLAPLKMTGSVSAAETKPLLGGGSSPTLPAPHKEAGAHDARRTCHRLFARGTHLEQVGSFASYLLRGVSAAVSKCPPETHVRNLASTVLHTIASPSCTSAPPRVLDCPFVSPLRDRHARPLRYHQLRSTCAQPSHRPVGIPPDIANWQRLASVPFDRAGMQVVSLFPDLDSQSRLTKSGLNLAISHPDQLAGDMQTELMRVFSDGPAGSPVIVIGHVNNGSFVIETASGGSIKLSAISEMARQTSRPVFLLGCYTAEHYQQPEPWLGFPVTTLTVLYPRELIDRLGSAGRNSKNLQDFTALISSADLYVQLPKDFLTTLPDQRRRLFARIASVTQNGARAITGFFRADLPCLFGGCP